MTNERTKFEAWATMRGFGMKKVPTEGNRYVSDTTQAAWEGYQAALASQQKPVAGLDEVALEVIEEIRDPNSVHPICPQGDMITLSMSEFTAYNHRLVEALGGQKPVEDFDPCAPCCVKPVPAGLDALVRSLHLKMPMATQEDAIDFAHRLVAELTQGQDPVWWHKHFGPQDDGFYTPTEEQPEGCFPTLRSTSHHRCGAGRRNRRGSWRFLIRNGD